MSTKDYISPSNVSSKPTYSSPIIIRNPKNVMLLCYMKFDINVEGYFEFYRRFRKQVVRNLKENETVSPTFEDVILMWCLERIDPKLPGLIYKKIGIKIFQAPQLCSLTDRIFELIPKLLENNQILNPKTDPLQAVFLPKCQTPEIKEELDEIKLDLEEVIPEQLDVKPSIEIGNSWSFSPILQNPGQVSQLENNSPLWKIKLPGGISSNDYEKPKIRVLPAQNVPNHVRIAKPIIIGPNGTPKFIRIAPKDYVPPKISQNSNAVPSKFPSIENSIQVGANPSKIVYFDKKKQKLTEGVLINNKIVSTDDLINTAVNQNKEPIPNVPNVMLKKIILKPKEIERLRECEQLESVDPIELKFNESKDEINMASYGCEEAISVASNENEDTMNLTSNEDDELMSIAPALNQEQNTEYLQVIRITPNQYIMLSNIFPDKFQYKERRSKEDGKMSVTLSLTELKLLKGLIKLFPGRYKNLNSIIVPSARASNENLNPGEIRKLKDIMGILKEGKEVSAKIKKRKLLSTNQKDEKKKKTNNASASNKEEIKRKSKKNNFQLLCPLCRKQITFGLLEVLNF